MPSTVRFLLGDGLSQDTPPPDAYEPPVSSSIRPRSILRRPTLSPALPSNPTDLNQNIYSSTYPSAVSRFGDRSGFFPPSQRAHKGQLELVQLDQVQDTYGAGGGQDDLSTVRLNSPIARGHARSSSLSSPPLSIGRSGNNTRDGDKDVNATSASDQDYLEMLSTKKIRRHRLSRSLSDQSYNKPSTSTTSSSSSSPALYNQQQNNTTLQDRDETLQFANNKETKDTSSPHQQYCHFPIDCKETKLNWSKYCYKHQCRAFLCHQHVFKSNMAYCVEHYSNSDPELVP